MSAQFFWQIPWLQKIITYRWIQWRKIHHLSFGNFRNTFFIMDYRNKNLRIYFSCYINMLHVLLPRQKQKRSSWNTLVDIDVCVVRRLGSIMENRRTGTTKILFWIFSIHSSASEKTKKLYCCKFIKMANKCLEPNVWLVAKYCSSLLFNCYIQYK